MSFKILTLDGGGIRGVISARILQEVEEQLTKPLNQYFDMIAGTSTGSILAAGIARGIKSQEIINLYKERGKEIFPYRTYCSHKRLPFILKYKNSILKDAVKGIFEDVSKTKEPRSNQTKLQQLLSIFKTGPKFSHDGLIKVIRETLGDVKIKDIQNTKILILAYDTYYRNTTFFTSHHTEKQRWYDDMELWQICVSSSSAPTFFPPYEFRWKENPEAEEWKFPHVDGGVAANNPSLPALCHAMGEEKQKIEDIAILSIGTGRTTEPFEYKQVKSWGLIDWAKHIPNVFMGGQAQIDDGISKQIMMAANPTGYLRLQFELNQRFDSKTPGSPPQLLPKEKQVNRFTNKKISEAIDDASQEKVQQLIDTAKAFINSADYQEVDGKSMTVKEAIADFIKANDNKGD